MSTTAPAKDTIEVWEVQTPSTVYVYQRDPRDPTGYRQTRVGGPNGTKRLRITTDDREFTEEQILEENTQLNPFRNGALKRVDGGDNAGIVTDEDLAELMTLEPEVFREAVGEMDSELTVRRLYELVQRSGTVVQAEIVRDIIEDRWKVGGTQKTVREMIDAQEQVGGQIVSG
jgi:hypothetical protein